MNVRGKTALYCCRSRGNRKLIILELQGVSMPPSRSHSWQRHVQGLCLDTETESCEKNNGVATTSRRIIDGYEHSDAWMEVQILVGLTDGIPRSSFMTITSTRQRLDNRMPQSVQFILPCLGV
jgi:hypothetical protein